MTVNLGTGGSLAYQPRCLRRALSAQQASECTADKSYALITKNEDIASFQSTMQAVPSVHVGGHFTIGGDPGSDIFSSNGDPVFFLHHAMIDRVWWIWQLQDLQTRLRAVAGSVTGQPGKQGSLTDQIQLGVNAGAVTIGDVMSTLGGMDGELCYIYA
jgi:tyrosinase